MIYQEVMTAPPWNRKEILRYARCKEETKEVANLLDACIAEAEPLLSYRLCYEVYPIDREDGISFGTIRSDSQTLMKALDGCDECVLFAATAGFALDRLIMRYGHSSPARALMLQALGAERIESLCDAFCRKKSNELAASEKSLRTRVSPGYGDIPLSMQKDIFELLDCPRKIGLTLNEKLLMSPSKSVTAVAGIRRGGSRCNGTRCDGDFREGSIQNTVSCAECMKKDCEFKMIG